MYQLFESIRLEEGVFINPELHEARMTRSLLELSGRNIHLRINTIKIPGNCRNGLFKCRVVYREDIESVEFIPYRLRSITSVGMVHAPTLEYSYKYCDRTCFDVLLKDNPGFDELLLVKEGCLTDSTYSNLAFYDGISWYTPATPLLAGTRRKSLLRAGKLIPIDVFLDDLERYSLVSFINAMTDLGELVFPVNKIGL